jgi:integrase
MLRTKVVNVGLSRVKVKPLKLHDLRDTRASLLAKAGVAIEVISKPLGHSNIQVTMDRYMHIYRERDAEAASMFDQLLAG